MTRALAACIAACIALPASAVEPEVVKLRFAWPAPAEAKVTYSRERTRTGKEPVASKASYTERVERRGDELWIFSGGMVAGAAEVPGLSPAEGATVVAELARAAEGLARVVGRDGAFLRLEGVDRAYPAIVAVLEKRLPDAQRELAARVAQTLKPALPVESQTHWVYAVGSWANKELEPGYWYETSGKAESPLAPGHPLTFVTKLGLVRRLPCDGEAPPACVELTLRSTPAPAEIPVMLDAMTRRLLSQLPPGKKAPEGPLFRDARMVDEVRLVTDPRALLPRTITWTRSVDLTTADGKTTVQRDVKNWTYAWKGAAK